MANALIYGGSGAGKTVNSTLVKAGNRGRNLLLCSDNSQVVLKHFDRKNLTIKTVDSWLQKDKKGVAFKNNYIDMFHEAVNSKKYDNIITDNLSDLFDLAVLQYREEKIYADIRQGFLEIYNTMKKLTRISGKLDCNCLFTAWEDLTELQDETGVMYIRHTPKLQAKILDNICGLMNIVGYVSSVNTDEGKKWQYYFESTPTLSIMAKDQLGCRKGCKPEELFII